MTNLCSTLQSLNSKLLSDSESEVDDVFKFKPISPVLLEYRRRQESPSSDGRSSTDQMFIPKSHDRFRSSSCDGRRHPGKPEYIHCRCCGKLKKPKVSFSDDVGDENDSNKSNQNLTSDEKSGYIRQRSESCDQSTRNGGRRHPGLKSGETDSDISSRIQSSGTELPKYEDVTDSRQTRGRHRERSHGRPPPVPHSSSSSRQRHQPTQSNHRNNDQSSNVSSDPTSVHPNGGHLQFFSPSRRPPRQEANFESKSMCVARSPTVGSGNTVDESSDHCSDTHSDIPIELIPSYIPEVVPRTFRSQSLDRNPRLTASTSSGIFENGHGKCIRRHNVTNQWSSYSVQGPSRSSDHRSDESNVSSENILSVSCVSSNFNHSINHVHTCNNVETSGSASTHQKDAVTRISEENRPNMPLSSREQSPNHFHESSPQCLPQRSQLVKSDKLDVPITNHSCEERNESSKDCITHRPPKPPVKSRTLVQKPPLPNDKLNPRTKIPTVEHKRMVPELPNSLSLTPNSRILSQGSDISEPNTPASLPPKPPPRVPKDTPPRRPPKPLRCRLQSSSFRQTAAEKARVLESNEPAPPLPPRGRPPRHPTDRPPDRPPKSWLQKKSTSVLATEIARLPSFSDTSCSSVSAADSVPPPIPPRARRSQSVDSVFNRTREGARGLPDSRRTASEGDNKKPIVEILV